MKLCKVYGVSVELSRFFLIFFGLLIILVSVSAGWRTAIQFTAIFVPLYSFVLLHEFGHVFAARRFGYGCEKVVMHPFGGLAHLKWSLFEYKPREEFWISIWGPLVNLGIAGIILPFALFYEKLFILVEMNLIMCAFNLLPLPVLDGGRVLRSFISPHCDNIYIATKYSTLVGCAFMIPLVIYFTFYSQNFWVIFLIYVIAVLGFQELRSTKFVAKNKPIYNLIANIKRLEKLLGD
jgi:Zn-dependent protease